MSLSKPKNLRIAFAVTVFLRYSVAKRDITLFDGAYIFPV